MGAASPTGRTRPDRLLAVVVLVLLVVLAAPTSATAEEDEWRVTRYDVVADVATDGSADITIDLEFDFGSGGEAHGPYLTIVERQEIEGDPDHYRLFEVSDVTAHSPSGAPATVHLDRDGSGVVVRVGEENETVEGLQHYVIGYRLDSLATPADAAGGLDQVVWNAVGLGWEVPIDDVSVTVRAPAEAIEVACVAGPVGSSRPCDAPTSTTEDAVTVGHSALRAGQGLTVAIAYPGGTFPAAQPRYADRVTWGNAFGLTAASGGVAAGVLAAGAGAVVVARRRYRRGTAGVDAASVAGALGSPLPAARGGGEGLPEGLRTTPPDGVPPGELGTLIDGVAQAWDAQAVLIDLAVRGAVQIEVLTEGVGVPEPDESQDVRLIRVPGPPPSDLRDYELDLLEGLFEVDSSVLVSEEATRVAGALGRLRGALDAAVAERGWFTARPGRVRTTWVVAGVVVAMLGIGATIALALTIGWGLVGVALILAGTGLAVAAPWMPARTAEGTRVTHEAKAFEAYLRDVTAREPQWPAGRAGLVPDDFERLLPYVVALRLEKEWAEVFDAAVESGELRQPDWYLSPGNAAFVTLWASGAFNDSLSHIGVVSTTTSDGSSGSSSISVGGGASGGGGGGW